jgi:hypothetical protein
METIAELERRITAALMRIGQAVEEIGPGEGSAPVATLADGVAEAEIARLNEALDEERMLVAQVTERLRTVRDKESVERIALQGEVDHLMKLLDVQGLELQRLKKTVAALREQTRVLTEAGEAGQIEPHLINKAMQTELEALRALRSAEAAELNEIIAALDPLVAPAKETRTDA